MGRAAKLGAGIAGVLGAILALRAFPGKHSLRRIALTGNIASGKSTVSEVWRGHGAVVIDADDLARDAVAPGSPGLRRVLAQFGDSVRSADGTLDRAALRSIVFADDRKRQILESILHPEIDRLRSRAEQKAAARGARIIVHAIPLLFEKGLDDQFDVIVLVDAPADVRRARIVTHRSLTEADAAAMLAAQMPAESKRPRSHYVIDNDGSLDKLKEDAAQVWSRIEEAP